MSHQSVDNFGQFERRVQLQPILLQRGRSSLLPVDQNHHVCHLKADIVQRPHGLQNRSTAGDQILDHQTRLPGPESSLDRLLGAVILHLLPPHDHGHAVLQRNAGGNRKRSVRDAADHIVVGVGHGVVHSLGHFLQQLRVRDDHSEVDVDRRGDAALEREAAELDSLHIVQGQNQLVQRHAHESNSAPRPNLTTNAQFGRRILPRNQMAAVSVLPSAEKNAPSFVVCLEDLIGSVPELSRGQAFIHTA
ncbi:hypothetical protein Mapa_000440 [Marchantia paleacea]|nr:hypothetical protein Mapa_000440 [Marchantia paleacea]